jgi:hypothetical protein
VGTAFTYQGQLKDGGVAASGQYDLQFALFDAASGGSQVGSTQAVLNQTVTDGLFTVQLDFGADAPFQGEARWLEIAARIAGGGSYTTLSPRQALTAAPYATSLMPGAMISGALGSPALSVANTTGAAVMGASTNGDGVVGNSSNGNGGQFTTSSTSGGFGVRSEAFGANSIGVFGTANNGSAASGVYGQSSTGSGVTGYSTANGSGVHAIYGLATGTDAIGVHGSSNNGMGMRGESFGTNGIGVFGTANNGSQAAGVYGQSSTGSGVTGYSTANGFTVHAIFGLATGTNARGVRGVATNNGVGVQGESSVVGGIGVFGTSPGDGVYGFSDTGIGVHAVSHGSAAVYAESIGPDSAGVFGEGGSYGEDPDGVGVYGLSTFGNGVLGWAGFENNSGVAGINDWSGNGLYGYSTSGRAAWLNGPVLISGTCTGCFGPNRIDHPLDPENKYLSHVAVQSDDMLDIYSGNVTTDATGEATVTMPDWFEALNKDFRYQLTPIGQFAQAIVASEIKDNHFTIKTDKPTVKVSWLVTGIRHDPYAEAHRVTVEEDKTGKDRGKYLRPTEYGQPESKGIDYERTQQMLQQPMKQPDKRGDSRVPER